jgi:hypothetical protein
LARIWLGNGLMDTLNDEIAGVRSCYRALFSRLANDGTASFSFSEVILCCGQSIDGEMKYSVDSKNRSDICRCVELRNHPLISYHGLPSWPPTWSPANPKSDLKSLRGEIGRLKYVLPNKTSDRCFLIIEHENEAYIGCLFFDDRIFCAQMVTILGNHAGLTVKEIGDLDLSRTL